MKRQIFCEFCGDKKFKEYPNEGVANIIGLCRFDCMCDSCGKSLKSNEVVHAISFYVTGRYIPWEEEFLDLKGYQDQVEVKKLLGIKKPGK
jgi:hypothetical protein